MMRLIAATLYISLIFLLSTGCQERERRPAEGDFSARSVANDVWEAPAQLDDYWYRGKAEITSFELSQNRYQSTHPGEVILIFVTEDFLPEQQVKDERKISPNSTKVLKTNMIREFTTGIYEYSIMTSVFTPVKVEQYPYTLKVTHGSQDWCGQSFMQINERSGEYRMQQFSYFEAEGDTVTNVPVLPLEDELFNRIRINPAGLPTGDIELLPGTTYCRLTHSPFEPVEANATLGDYTGDRFEGEQLRVYRLEFPSQRRTLEIVFEKVTPYRIVGWTESYPSMFDGKVRTTVAKAKETIVDAYWKHNRPEDRNLRTRLEVEGL